MKLPKIEALDLRKPHAQPFLAWDWPSVPVKRVTTWIRFRNGKIEKKGMLLGQVTAR